MRYPTIDDLPVVCKLNLPEAAQHAYKDAYNEAWQAADDSGSRERHALNHAWAAVRERFEKDPLTGSWIPKATPMQPHVVKAVAESREIDIATAVAT